MDPIRTEDRLLWLEARAMRCAAEARRIRVRARGGWISPRSLARRIAEVEQEIGAREDELRLWRSYLAAPAQAARRPWWRRLWPW